MDQVENSIMKKSQIRPPSRIPSPGKGLSEISEAQNNSRLKPPSSSTFAPGIKYNGASVRTVINEEPKRKTLAERAGEPARSNIGTIHEFRASVKGTSLASARSGSFASSRAPSSRNTSNSSFASSMGPGSRPPSSYGKRPQTSMAFSHSVSGRPPVSSIPSKRSSSSMDDHLDGGDEKRKGMNLNLMIPTIPMQNGHMSLQYPKPRGSRNLMSIRELASGVPQREVSVSTALSKLHIDDHTSESSSAEHQASSSFSESSFGSSNDRANPAMQDSDGDSSSAIVVFKFGERALIPPKTPSQIPVARKVEALALCATPATPSRPPRSASPTKPQFLTKDSNVTSFKAWDVQERLENVEAMFTKFAHTVNDPNLEHRNRAWEEAAGQYKIRVLDLEGRAASLESMKAALETTNATLEARISSQQMELDANRQRILKLSEDADDDRRKLRLEMEEEVRKYRRESDDLRREMTEELDRIKKVHQRDLNDEIKRLERIHQDKIWDLEQRNNALLQEEARKRIQEVQEIKGQIAVEQQNLDAAVGSKDREIENMRGKIEELQGELDREQTLKKNLEYSLSNYSSTIVSLESKVRSLKDRIQFLESGSKAQSDRFASMEQQLEEALEVAKESKAKLIKEETLRRILFNQVQELKGNIRVMCRVRPPSTSDDVAKINYPDLDKESKELEMMGPEEKSSLGTITRKTNAFSFDRVFGPATKNEEVFGEISQLVQSALDGYNVCIFCYGQTGAGKTHTMSSADGMIPRATHMIYEKATELQEKGWTYQMEGSFVEVYNEEIHDLLGNPKEFDKKKHEIKHDDKKKQTTVTNLQTILLDSPNAVESILKKADANRSVAATKSNERSSRSHSVFILKLIGKNSTTGETSEGTLNLVDLAGSERLKSSGAEGDRMKETQNINKSLSCLGDVIGALGQGKEGTHIPYRNSKLTYLLQYSLGGNSKTLMFVMISPLEQHLKETLTSLKFATKVHNTHIGTAKKSKRITEA